jgi:two-component system sensor histidine kinase RegB
MHLHGMWFAFICTALFASYFLTKIIESLNEQESKLRRLRETLAHQEQLALIASLTAGAAHELGSPLGTIAIAAYELKRRFEKLDFKESELVDLNLILAEVERVKSIIQKIADQTQGEIEDHLSPLSVVVEDCCKLADSKGINCTFRRSELNSYSVPYNAVFRALNELIKNSIDSFADLPGKINISLSKRDRRLELIVEDSGRGMSLEELQKVGTPFFTTKEFGRGMGLGIFLSRLLAERLGGTLSYQSVEGRGTKAIWSLEQYETIYC